MNIAVMLPTHEGRSAMLAAAIESVVRQSVPNWRLLIWGDGYNPNWREWGTSPQIPTPRYNSTRQGEAASRNSLMAWWRAEHADCELGCWLDDDDIMHLHRLYYQATYMEQNPDVALAFCDMGIFLDCEDGERLAAGSFEILPNRTADVTRYDSNLRSYRNNLLTPTGMFRPVVAETPFNVEIQTGGCDLLWLYELVGKGLRIGHLPRQLYYQRQHEERLTLRRRRMDDTIVQADLARFRSAAEQVRQHWHTAEAVR